MNASDGTNPDPGKRPFTNVAKTEPFRIGDAADAVRFDHVALADFPCPIILFDHVRMRSSGFPPHPHAGLCVFSYLLEDSPGALRDRDTLNEEVVLQPGDLLWFQMASGLIHEENPAVDGLAIHQLQVWVNLSRRLHSLEPQTFLLRSADVPVAADASGNRVRVVLGSYGGAASPLVPTEPFTFLDMTLSAPARLAVPAGTTGILYLLRGGMTVRSGVAKTLRAGEVVGVGPGIEVEVAPDGAAHVLYMARPVLDQPLVVQGMYAMSSQEEIDSAKRRFHAGGFGDVTPYPKLKNPGAPYVPPGQDPELAATATVLRQATVRHYDEGWWKLHLQYCRFDYSDYETAHGYRFVWEDPDGGETPYRTAGYIPYLDYAAALLRQAEREGWGDIPYRDSF